MVKKIILLFLIAGFSLIGCGKEDADSKKQLIQSQKIEKLKKECKNNETIEEWKVKKIISKPGNLKEISLIRKADGKESKIIVEGFNDLEEGTEVLVKVSVNDLSLNQKYGEELVAQEFLTIVDY
jgi:ribosomal protein L2